MSEGGTEGLFRRQGRGKRAAARGRQQAPGGERWFQCWDGPPATKWACGDGGPVDNASFENSLLGIGARGALGDRHRAALPPADDRGLTIAGPRALCARVARGAGRKERRRGCKSAPQSKDGGGARIPWCRTRVQEMDVCRERETASLS